MADGALTMRTLTIDGRRTTVRLEPAFWCALDDICAAEGVSLQALCQQLETRRGATSRAATLRVLAASYLAARHQPMTQMDLDGAAIWYSDTGRGEPVVALHSSASSGKQWSALGERLAADFRLLAPDLYGYGKTADWAGPAPLDLGDEAAIVAAMAALCDGPVHLVGHSYGGVVALRALMDRRVAVP